MPARKVALVLALFLVAPCLVPCRAQAQNVARLKAVMIYASEQPAPIDERLESIEYKLRRVFKFEHYLHYGEGKAVVTMPGSGTIKLGKGYVLDVNASKAKGGKIRAKVTWRKGDKRLLSATQVVGRKTPVVMGGVSHEKGTLIVTLVLE